MNEFGKLDQEVTNLGRLIKIFESIALAKKKYGDLQCESFFGFLQSPLCFLKLIAIDSLKIFDDSKSYIKSITKNFLRDDHLSKLFRYSKIQVHLNEIQKLVSPLRDYRNKLYAHLENAELQNISCNLGIIYIALANFYCSLRYILTYLVNPHYIAEEKWDNLSIQHYTEDTIASSSLEKYLQQDPSLTEFISMLSEVQEKLIQ